MEAIMEENEEEVETEEDEAESKENVAPAASVAGLFGRLSVSPDDAAAFTEAELTTNVNDDGGERSTLTRKQYKKAEIEKLVDQLQRGMNVRGFRVGTLKPDQLTAGLPKETILEKKTKSGAWKRVVPTEEYEQYFKLLFLLFVKKQHAAHGATMKCKRDDFETFLQEEHFWKLNGRFRPWWNRMETWRKKEIAKVKAADVAEEAVALAKKPPKHQSGCQYSNADIEGRIAELKGGKKLKGFRLIDGRNGEPDVLQKKMKVRGRNEHVWLTVVPSEDYVQYCEQLFSSYIKIEDHYDADDADSSALRLSFQAHLAGQYCWSVSSFFANWWNATKEWRKDEIAEAKDAKVASGGLSTKAMIKELQEEVTRLKDRLNDLETENEEAVCK